jgi:5-dehydro-2-deoxygluconokinase
MHPDDEPELWQQQARQLEELYRACCVSGHELLIEVIPPAASAQDDQTMVRALQLIYQRGIRPDWWKLPPQSKTSWAAISELVAREAPHCRGVILLGLDAPAAELMQAFTDSAAFPLCKGFAIGRTIFAKPSQAWLAGNMTDTELQQQIRDNYRALVQAWLNRKATDEACV